MGNDPDLNEEFYKMKNELQSDNFFKSVRRKLIMINKMKIERWILITDQYSCVEVRTVGFIYRLNVLSMIDKRIC